MQRTKTGLAHHPFEHHAPGHPRVLVVSEQRVGGLVTVNRKQVCRTVQGFEVVRKSDPQAVLLALPDDVQFFAALVNELVLINGGGRFGCGIVF